MKPSDWLRLLVPGICVGMLSACSNSSKNTQQSPPGFSQLPNFGYGSSQQQAHFPQSAAPSRSLASTPASKYPASFPTPSFEPKTAATPYGLIAYGPFNPSAVTRVDGIKRTPLPTRPQNLPETDAEELVRMPNDVVEMAASKPQSGSVTIVEPLTLPQTLTTEEPSTQKPAAASPEEPPLLHALRCFLEKRPDDFRETLKTLDASQRDVLQTLIPLMVNVGDGQFAKSDPRELAAAVDQLQALLWVLRPRAALVMDKFCFCREVKKFGQFEPLGSKQSFRPGDMVEVYAEIRNVSSVPRRSEHGEYRTHLRSRLNPRPSGEMVKFFDGGKPDETLTPQHDYYQAYRFSIPEAPAGAYTLNLEVRDVPTGRKVKQKLEFQIGQ